MHDIDVVHGDLTTSNIMVRGDAINGYSEVILIDFGLGQMQSVIEDKAVDLYVLERAFISTHPGSEYLVSIIHYLLFC
jgi:TP53 regulating kinase-like protein